MSGTTSAKGRLAAAAALAVSGAVLLGACGGEIRAEMQGAQLGEAICDVRNADSLEDAERELEQAAREMDDVQRIVGRPIEEDVDDIEENLRDLSEHAAEGNDALLDQDVSVIQRNVDAIRRTLNGKAEAAYDGLLEGLANCDY